MCRANMTPAEAKLIKFATSLRGRTLGEGNGLSFLGVLLSLAASGPVKLAR